MVKVAQQLKDPKSLATAYQLLGLATELSGDNQAALKHFPQTIELFRQIPNHLEEAKTLNFMAQSLNSLKEYENFDPTHAAALEAFGRLSNPASLTQKQERLLAFLETEYGI